MQITWQLLEGDVTIFHIVFQNTSRKYLLEVENEKKKKTNAMNLLKAGNKDVRIKHVVLSDTFQQWQIRINTFNQIKTWYYL